MHDNAHRFMVLDGWLQTPLGGYVAALEAHFFARKLAACGHGCAVQVGLPQWRLLAKWPDGGHVVYQHYCAPADVCAQPECLPWPENSLDVVVLPHGLDVCADPAILLAEVRRVLVPRGQLLLSGFNPAGYWRMAARGLNKQLCLRSVSSVRHLLADAGLTVEQGAFMGYAWPWQRQTKASPPMAIEYMGNRWWPHLAAVYGLVAHKEVLGLRPDNTLAKQLRQRQQPAWQPAGHYPKAPL